MEFSRKYLKLFVTRFLRGVQRMMSHFASEPTELTNFMSALPSDPKFQLLVLRDFVFKNLALFPNTAGVELNLLQDELVSVVYGTSSSEGEDEPLDFDFAPYSNMEGEHQAPTVSFPPK
jgi:hypothetical protein